MKKRRAIAMVVLLLGLVRPAQADKVSVLTSYDCDFLNSALAQNYEGAEQVILYVAGYLSGVAVASGENFLNGVDIRSIKKEVISQCKLQPGSKIIDIAGLIEDKLRGR